MTNLEVLQAAIIATLTAGRQDRAGELNAMLDNLPDFERAELAREIVRYSPGTDLAALCAPEEGQPLKLLTADALLKTSWPEPVWAIPGLLPVGLAILAGAPKVGKSWLALQVAQAVAAGGIVLGRQVVSGPVLYLALEDPPRRLQERMKRQNWPLGLEAEFMTVGTFLDQIGDLRNGGGERLANQIEHRGYRFVAIDTLSRTIAGDQNDVQQMTTWLTPIQAMAHEKNCAVVLIDHHRKTGSVDPDAIADILGSTAKGAMTDTALGLYRERGKAGARLLVTGRDLEERTLNLQMDWLTGCWQLDTSSEGMTDQQADLLNVLEQIGPIGVQDLAEAVGHNKGTVYKQLAELEQKGKVTKSGRNQWDIIRPKAEIVT